MNKTFEVFTTKTTSKMVEHNDLFELKRKGKYVWLQKACFYILKKLRCTALIKQEDIQRIRIDAKDVIEKLIKQKVELLKYGYPNDLEIFIGADQMNTIVLSNNNFMTFTAPIGYNRQILGIDVTVVPWMDGILVVPKERKRVN